MENEKKFTKIYFIAFFVVLAMFLFWATKIKAENLLYELEMVDGDTADTIAGETYPTGTNRVRECFGNYPTGASIGTSGSDYYQYIGAWDLDTIFDTSGGAGTYYFVSNNDGGAYPDCDGTNSEGYSIFYFYAADNWDTWHPAMSWDDENLYDYADEIKDFRWLWHEYQAGSGSAFGLGVDIQNELGTWDELILQVSSPSINESWDLTQITSGTLQNPSITIDSTDFVEWWQDGTYDLVFYLSFDGTPDSGTTLEITLGQPLIETTKAEWDDFATTPFVIEDVEDWAKYKETPMSRWLESMKEKFPIGWLWTVYDIWNEEYESVVDADTASDSFAVSFTMPGGVAFAGTTYTLLDLTWAKDNFGDQFDAIRQVLTYVIWIVAVFVIIKKTKGFIASLNQNA